MLECGNDMLFTPTSTTTRNPVPKLYNAAVNSAKSNQSKGKHIHVIMKHLL